MRRKHIGLVSGGTGGHLWPAVALSRELERAGYRTSVLTEGRPVERSLLERAGCESLTVGSAGRGVGRLARLPASTLAARKVLRGEGIDAVVGTGGGATVPVALAARSLGLPLCLLEQNAVVGRANRVLRPLARRIYMGLPTDRRHANAMLAGTPLRQEFGGIERERARRELGLDDAAPVVLVTGGSQGAQVLNEIVPEALCALHRPVQVVHLSGEGNDSSVRSRYAAGQDHGVQAIVRPISVDMASLFAAADLVVCRGGGCTISELIVAGRPAVIVPYPHHADQQQLLNARILEDVGAAVVIEQTELDVEMLADVVGDLCRDPSRLEAMGASARAVAPANAATTIVEDLERVIES